MMRVSPMSLPSRSAGLFGFLVCMTALLLADFSGLVRPVRAARDLSAAGNAHVVIVAGDAEYGSRRSMAAFGDRLRDQFGFKVTLIESTVGVLENEANPDKSIPGLEVLEEADLLVIYVRMRIPPQEQLDLLHAYFEAGKPAIGLRTTTHGFTNDRGWCPRYFGGHYWRHEGEGVETFALPQAQSHPILRGVPRHEWNEASSLYTSGPLSDTAQALVLGRIDNETPPQPFAWVNEYKAGSRQFFATMGHPEDIALPGNQALLCNATFWCLGMEVPSGGVLNPAGGGDAAQAARAHPAPPDRAPPGGAEVLFDGGDLARWDWWFGGKEPSVYGLDGRAHSGAGLPEFVGARWRVDGGAAIAGLGYGDIVSRERFADIRFHCDFLIPETPMDTKRIWKGNSGVYLNGRYEVQILDSHGDATLDENACGAINGMIAPSLNACRPAGQWQTLDVTFKAARFARGSKVSNARMTVQLNGQTIHNNVELEDSTVWGFPEEGSDGPLLGPVRLQADSAPVRFANVWVTAIGPGAVEAALPTPLTLTGDEWSDMNYGPYTTLSLEVYRGNIAYKGIAIRVDEGKGGVSKGNEFMLFDTDTLRFAGAWTGPEFINWRGIFLNGQHEIHPKIVGDLVFSNPVGPGWGRPGDESFADDRVVGRDGLMYGPTARDWMHWKGLYLHENRVLLNYTVGDTEILELPGSAGTFGNRVFTRTFNIGPRQQDLILQVAHLPGTAPEIIPRGGGPGLAIFEPNEDAPRPLMGEENVLAFDGQASIQIDRAEDFASVADEYTIYARIKTRRGGTILSIADQGEEWIENGRTLFVQEGHLIFDIGWVGAVESESTLDDGDWHHVAMTYRQDREEGLVRLYVDGRFEGEETLAPEEALEDPAVRIGYTSNNFPEGAPTFFIGEMSEVGYYRRALDDDEIRSMARRFRRGNPRRIENRGLIARWVMNPQKDGGIVDRAQKGHDGILSRESEQTLPASAAAVRGGPSGMQWMTTDDGHLRLRIPAGEAALRLCVVQGRLPEKEGHAAFVDLANQVDADVDLTLLTRGGPPRWRERLTTEGELGDSRDAYAIDVLTPPMKNPFRSWLRFGGFDFFKDDSTAAICTWNGDVWLVRGIDDSLKKLEWQRIATGMFQPLGLKIVDEEIFVICRDQMTKLHDLNGDGEIDFYENFNNDQQVTEHFHEFALDLQIGIDGDFYYTKGGRHAADSIVPHHGTLIRVARDGSTSEIISNGFRAPNGLGMGPKGEILIADNQGHWIPANRINWVKPGGFYGYMWGYIEGQEIDGYDLPLCWIHPSVDRSPSTFVWVPDDRWGPFKDRVITVSYGMGQIFHVLYEEVDGVVQGGVVRFPLEFDSGICRADFRDSDGQLYLAGLFGWAGNKTRPGGFYRVRYTGQPVHLPAEIHIASDGLSLTFTGPLDPDRATDYGNYGVSVWNYKWRAQYGSPDYKRNGEEGRDTLAVTSASLSQDKRTVYLRIPDISEVMQMEIRLNIAAEDGTPIKHSVHNTINVVPKVSIEAWMSGDTLRGQERAADVASDLPLGLVQTLSQQEDPDKSDTRVSRLVALYCPEGQPVTPFLPAGPFVSTWEGFIRGDINDDYTFTAVSNGRASVTVNGETVLRTNARGRTTQTRPVGIRSGLNPIKIVYRSPRQGSAEFRLDWESATIEREPVPATHLVRRNDPADLERGLALRRGRGLFAQHRCLQCHAKDTEVETFAMPELAFEAPKLDHIGEKFRLNWVARYLENPQDVAPHSVMPSVLTSQAQAADIAAYLAGLSPAGTSEPRLDLEAEKVARGESLHRDLGCFSCHRFSAEEPYGPEDHRVAYVSLAGKWKLSSLTTYLQNPHRDYPSSPMPNFQLTDGEASVIAHYLLSESVASGSSPSPAGKGNAQRGKELITSRGCLNCHALADHVSTLMAGSLSSIIISGFDSGCLATPDGNTMGSPSFPLTPEDRDALCLFLTESVDSISRYTPLEFAERHMQALNCRACHSVDGSGNTWSLLEPEPVKEEQEEDPFADPFADWDQETVEEAAKTINYHRPPLDWAGEKLNSAWMKAFIAGEVPYKARPKLLARMPAFPAYAEGIAEGLAQQHGFPPSEFQRRSVDEDLARIGKQLTSASQGFNCAACHAIGDQQALAGADTVTINFRHVPERLRPAYYHRYIRNPSRVLPGTQMPRFLTSEGESSIEGVFEGDAQKQFDAIWEFLIQLSGE